MDLRTAMPDAWPVFFRDRTPRDVQCQAMPFIVQGASVMLSGPTASGKTEAALAPLYQRHVSFGRRHTSVLYIAPTRALVNDMYERLLGYVGATTPHLVRRYTGEHHEFSTSDGSFLLLATPEALDSLQLMRPERLVHVRAVVVDELHLLHGTARGQQLRAVLSRIRERSHTPSDSRDAFQLVGMTATLRNVHDVGRAWTRGDVQVVQVGGGRAIDMEFVESTHASTAAALGDRIRSLLASQQASKFLVFANTRNGGHKLVMDLAERLKGTQVPLYFHVGVLSQSTREDVEDAMRRDRRGVCVATSTLEVGIDIGDVDVVVLAEPPNGVSAFLQRIGRGNRRTGRCRVWACADGPGQKQLYESLKHCADRGEVDDVHDYHRPSVDFQQILSVVWRGMRTDKPLTRTGVMASLGGAVDAEVIDDMLATGALRSVRGALVPPDQLIDLCDAREMHTVIAGGRGRSMVDVSTGDELGSSDGEFAKGQMVYSGSGVWRVHSADGRGVYVEHGGPTVGAALMRLPSTGGRSPGLSRQVAWARAQLKGQEPRTWRQLEGTLVTWGGADYNRLLVAVMRACDHPKGLTATPNAIHGVTWTALTPAALSAMAYVVDQRRLIPRKTAERFMERSRFLRHLSPAMAADEAHRSLPFQGLQEWLQLCSLRQPREAASGPVVEAPKEPGWNGSTA